MKNFVFQSILMSQGYWHHLGAFSELQVGGSQIWEETRIVSDRRKWAEGLWGKEEDRAGYTSW